MNKTTTHKPTRSSFSLLHQLCNLIPAHLVPQLARDTGVIKRSRTFKPWSHVVSLLYAQLTHAIGLNDVCDGLRLHSGPLSAVRGATPPSKNALSTANRERSAQMAQDLFPFLVVTKLFLLIPGRACHSVRAAVVSKPNGSSVASPHRAAGRGLPAPPLCLMVLVVWIIA
jgi:hypothetical protein